MAPLRKTAAGQGRAENISRILGARAEIEASRTCAGCCSRQHLLCLPLLSCRFNFLISSPGAEEACRERERERDNGVLFYPVLCATRGPRAVLHLRFCPVRAMRTYSYWPVWAALISRGLPWCVLKWLVWGQGIFLGSFSNRHLWLVLFCYFLEYIWIAYFSW